jgi:uncharacterized protein YegL
MKSRIIHNLLDQDQFSITLEESATLKKLIEQNSRIIPEFQNLAFDMFLVLYKIILRLNPDLPINEHFILVSAISSTPKTELLRLRTKGSRWESYLAMKLLLDLLINRLRGTTILDQLKSAAKDTHYTTVFSETAPKVLDNLYSLTEKQLISGMHQKAGLDSTQDELSIFTEVLMNTLEISSDNEAYLKRPDPPLDIPDTLSTTDDSDGKNALESFIHKAHESAMSSDDSINLDTLLDEVLKKEGEMDDQYSSSLKEDFEKRFSPYLKSLILSEGSSDQVIERFTSTLDETESVSSNQLVDGKPNKSKAPIDRSFNRLITEDERIELLKNPEIEKQLDALNLDNLITSTSSKLDAFENNIQMLGIPKESMNLLSFDEVIALYNRTKNPKFIDFINRVGRLKSTANRIAHRKKRARITPVDGIRHSNDIDSLIEDELIQFALDIDAFENDFYDRYLRDDLLTIEMSAEKHKRKGPIILCYDGSGSMQGVKFEETVMHILSILEIAKVQKRRMVIIQFASASEPMYIKTINPLAVTSQDILDILDTFICGGTNFEKPLAHAMSIIKSSKHKNSDILFITDGQCEISNPFKEAFKKLKHERQFKLYTIIMHSYTYQDYGDIGDISDEILDIKGAYLGNWSEQVNEHIYSII